MQTVKMGMPSSSGRTLSNLFCCQAPLQIPLRVAGCSLATVSGRYRQPIPTMSWRQLKSVSSRNGHRSLSTKPKSQWDIVTHRVLQHSQKWSSEREGQREGGISNSLILARFLTFCYLYWQTVRSQTELPEWRRTVAVKELPGIQLAIVQEQS